MIVLAWFAAAVGLIFTRQFFHEVRWASRIPWGVLTLAVAGMVAYAVSGMPRLHMLRILFEIGTAGGIASVLWFIWRYSRMESWWRFAVGSTIVYKDIALVALYLLIGAALIGFQVSPWLSLSVLLVMPPIMIWRTEVWQRIHDLGGSGKVPGAAEPDAGHEAEQSG